jgi:hypothetical protein
MCAEQMSCNQTWSLVDEQITATVAETELNWKKAEPFFRSKQKRGGDTRVNAAQEFRGKTRKVLPVVPMKITPIGGDIVRPSLIPKKIMVKSGAGTSSFLSFI